MSKWFDVSVTVNKIFAVEVEDNESSDDAIAYAMDKFMDEFMSENAECEGFNETSELYTKVQIKH